MADNSDITRIIERAGRPVGDNGDSDENSDGIIYERYEDEEQAGAGITDEDEQGYGAADAEVEGEDLMDHLLDDYIAIPQLDQYEHDESIDGQQYDVISPDQRRSAEFELDNRYANDRLIAGGLNVGAIGLDDAVPQSEFRTLQSLRRRRAEIARQDRAQEMLAMQAEINPDEIQARLTEEQRRLQYEAIQYQDESAAIARGLLRSGMSIERFYADTQVRFTVKSVWKRFIRLFGAQAAERAAWFDQMNDAAIAQAQQSGVPQLTGKYAQRLLEVLSSGSLAARSNSLIVEWSDLAVENDRNLLQLAADIPVAPLTIIPLLQDATMEFAHRCIDATLAEGFPLFNVRFEHYPTLTPLCDLRVRHLNRLVSVRGVVTQVKPTLRRLVECRYRCARCGMIQQTVYNILRTGEPRRCENEECRKLALERIPESCKYQDVQYVLIHEPPNDVAPGRLPASREVELTDDCARGVFRPGDHVTVTGTLAVIDSEAGALRNGFPVFQTVLRANHIQADGEHVSDFSLTSDEVVRLKQLAAQPGIIERLIDSVAPSIRGHMEAKRAVALSLFGGVEKVVRDHTIRGDIHTLLMGDPSTGKSQLLKYASQLAPRAIFTSGKGASAVGLTAAVIKDPVTGEFVLEGGALVLADRGIVLIDEFEKMSANDRSSINGALSDQKISISKAGIITELHARCAVVAAANPIKGRYDPKLTLLQNVDIEKQTLDRFDIVCVVRDGLDVIFDQETSRRVVGNHRDAHLALRLAQRYAAEQQGAGADMRGMDPLERDWYVATQLPSEPIPQSILRKYISYARTLHPASSPQLAESNLIPETYSRLRDITARTGSTQLSARTVSDILRISEAFARMRLSNFLSRDDVERSVSVIIRSIISTLKVGMMENLEKQLIPLIKPRQDVHAILARILHKLFNDRYYFQQQWRNREGADATAAFVDVPKADFQHTASQYGFSDADVTDFLASWAARGASVTDTALRLELA